MAKVTLTLEDSTDSDSITVSMDMGAAPGNSHGNPLPTPAVRMARQFWELASDAVNTSRFPPHRLQPTNKTVH